MALPACGSDQCCQSLSSSLLHNNVQRLRVVSTSAFDRFSARRDIPNLAHWSFYPEQARPWIRFHANFAWFSDYINPIDLCNRLNTYIVPEAAVHAFLTFLFLINGYWLALLLNLPLLAFNGKKYVIWARATRERLLTKAAGQDIRKSTLAWCDRDLQEAERTQEGRIVIYATQWHNMGFADLRSRNLSSSSVSIWSCSSSTYIGMLLSDTTDVPMLTTAIAWSWHLFVTRRID